MLLAAAHTKIVKCLFSLAKHRSPSVIFLDEVDALVGTRGIEGEHEASRRFKTELFVQIDDVVAAVVHCGDESSPLVTILAASNNPWDLDEAMRRRLEKRIYVGLPDEVTRKNMFAKYVGGMMKEGEMDGLRPLLEILAIKTEGYSGADIELVCREAKMERMRRFLENVNVEELLDGGGNNRTTSDNISGDDLVRALGNVKKTVRSVEEYLRWNDRFGTKV